MQSRIGNPPKAGLFLTPITTSRSLATVPSEGPGSLARLNLRGFQVALTKITAVTVAYWNASFTLHDALYVELSDATVQEISFY